MVEEVLVRERESLTTQHIACGAELLRRTKRAGMKVVAAYWVRDRLAETGTWELKIVTPEVDRDGPLQVYRRLDELISLPRISYGFDLNAIEVKAIRYS